MTYAGNPNGQNQRWSSWVFEVHEVGRHVPRNDVEYNVAKWLRAGFGSAGKVKVERMVTGWRMRCLVEGPPAHDPGFVASVREQFQARFVAKGWGPLSWGTVSVRLMAGSREDGRPAAQLVEMPMLIETKV